MLLWANLHGAFIAGFVTWFIYGVGIAWDALIHKNTDQPFLSPKFSQVYLLGGTASFAATLINPSGLGLWKTSVGYLGEKYLVDNTFEYQSPNFHEIQFWPFLFFIILLIVLIGMSKRRHNTGRLLTSTAWISMGLYSARNIPLAAILSSQIMVESLEDWITISSPKIKILNGIRKSGERLKYVENQLKGILFPILSIIVAVVGLWAGIHLDIDGQGYSFDREKFPVEAVDWLEKNPQDGEMFNYFIWGGYLLYRLWPEEQVFIDAQTDFYGVQLTQEYGKVIFGQEGWEQVLNKYQIEWAILPSDESAVHALIRDCGWNVVYEDSTAVILRNH